MFTVAYKDIGGNQSFLLKPVKHCEDTVLLSITHQFIN